MALPYLNDRQNQLRLTGQTEPLNWPRLWISPSGEFMHRLHWFLKFIVIGLGFVLLDAFRMMLLTPVFFLFAELLRWAMYFREEGFRRPGCRILYAPILTTWFLTIAVPALASVVSLGLWAFSLIVLAGWRLLRMTKALREHYLDYVIENPQLTVSTRRKWKLLRKNGFAPRGDEGKPACNLSAAGRNRFENAIRKLRGFKRLMWASWALIIVVAIGAAVVVERPVAIEYGTIRSDLTYLSLFILIGPMALGLVSVCWRQDTYSSIRLVHRCILVWCQSPPNIPEEQLAPWSARSRFGRADERIAYLHWNLFLFSALLLPVAVYYPVYATDMVSLHSRGDYEPYPISGSKYFLHLKDGLTNFRTSLSARLRIVWGTFAGMGVIVTFTWLLVLAPTLQAAETLIEGPQALEQERQGLTGTTLNERSQS